VTRGINRQDIFCDQDNYQRFLRTLDQVKTHKFEVLIVNSLKNIDSVNYFCVVRPSKAANSSLITFSGQHNGRLPG
jgi:hypothetical protein